MREEERREKEEERREKKEEGRGKGKKEECLYFREINVCHFVLICASLR